MLSIWSGLNFVVWEWVYTVSLTLEISPAILSLLYVLHCTGFSAQTRRTPRYQKMDGLYVLWLLIDSTWPVFHPSCSAVGISPLFLNLLPFLSFPVCVPMNCEIDNLNIGLIHIFDVVNICRGPKNCLMPGCQARGC